MDIYKLFLHKSLSDGEIQILRVSVMNWCSEYPSFKKLLSQEEEHKAAKFHSEKDCIRYVVSRGILKHIISKYLGIAITDVVIHQKNGKKPYLEEQNGKSFYFNISHSKEDIVLAFSHDTPIGIDLEIIRPIPNFLSIVQNYFSEEEIIFISSQKKNFSQLEAFYHCWTRREAFLKAIGVGILHLEMWQNTSFLQNSISFSQSNSYWTICSISIGEMLSCALSYEISNKHIIIKKPIQC